MSDREKTIAMALDLFLSQLSRVQEVAQTMQKIYGANLRPRIRSSSVAEIENLGRMISTLEKGEISAEIIAYSAGMCEKSIDYDLFCVEAGSSSLQCRATAQAWLELSSDLERFQ